MCRALSPQARERLDNPDEMAFDLCKQGEATVMCIDMPAGCVDQTRSDLCTSATAAPTSTLLSPSRVRTP